MKKKKKKKFFLKKSIFYNFFILIVLCFSLLWVTYAIDVIWDYIKTQTSSWIWTNQNQITFSKHKTTYYINKDNDDIFTWDMLRWYYVTINHFSKSGIFFVNFLKLSLAI